MLQYFAKYFVCFTKKKELKKPDFFDENQAATRLTASEMPSESLTRLTGLNPFGGRILEAKTVGKVGVRTIYVLI